MPQPNSINPPLTPFVDVSSGVLSKEGWRFLYSLNRNTSEASTGEVLTPVGSGLTGGGFVANGITIGIAAGGVTNEMIRNGLPTSVIGRFQNSNGDVADIQATANDRVLARQSNQLVFTNFLDAISIGTNAAAPLVRTDVLELTAAPASSIATVTHSIPIETASGTFYVLLSSTP